MATQRQSRKLYTTGLTVLLALVLGLGIYARNADTAMSEGNANWISVRDRDLQIAAASALDFSTLFPIPPGAGTAHITTDTQGHFTLGGKRIRFLSAVLVHGGPNGGFPDHAGADVLARQLRMHGYNLARLHFVDATLMQGRVNDFDFDPVQLDHFFYLLSALKREGIFWEIDAMTSWNGAYGDVGANRFNQTHELKLAVYTDPTAQKHWKRLVDNVLTLENPYTGLPTLQDPMLALVTLVNEGGLGFTSRKGYSPILRPLFRDWLARRYGDPAQLRKAWGAASPESWSDITLPGRYEHSARAADMARFSSDLERSTARWMTDYLREKGYAGLITSFNNGKDLQASIARQDMDVVTMHAYFDRPNNFVRPGSRETGESSLPQLAPYMRQLASARHWGKPFLVDEYDHVFWNSWRREAGILIPAYASLQDWDGISRFANPVVLGYGMDRVPRHQAIYPFGIGMDPIARAGETLAALLYRRGDLQVARSAITIDLNQSYLFEKRGALGQMPEDISRLALLTGVGLRLDGQGRPGQAKGGTTLNLQPSDPVSGRLQQGLGILNSRLGMGTESRWKEQVAGLHARGVLKPANRTDVEQGVYESDTGEILLDSRKHRLQVVTPRTAAVVFDNGLPIQLKHLRIETADGPALVAASSLDGLPLDQSRRILLTLASDAQNSGMGFADPDRKVLLSLGQLPVKIRTAKVSIFLAHRNPDGLQLYALALNGERQSSLPLHTVPGGVRITLENWTLENGPTTFFELTR